MQPHSLPARCHTVLGTRHHTHIGERPSLSIVIKKRRTKPELAAIQLRSPMFVRLTAAQIAKLKSTELSSDGWARDDAFELLDLYADDIVQKLCTRDEKPNEDLSVNIGLGALQTRWCFRCGEFMRQHRVDRHTKSKAHKRNVSDTYSTAPVPLHPPTPAPPACRAISCPFST